MVTSLKLSPKAAMSAAGMPRDAAQETRRAPFEHPADMMSARSNQEYSATAPACPRPRQTRRRAGRHRHGYRRTSRSARRAQEAAPQRRHGAAPASDGSAGCRSRLAAFRCGPTVPRNTCSRRCRRKDRCRGGVQKRSGSRRRDRGSERHRRYGQRRSHRHRCHCSRSPGREDRSSSW